MSSEDSDGDAFMPQLPPHLLKSSHQDKESKRKHDSESEDEDSYVPTLPPHLINKKSEKEEENPGIKRREKLSDSEEEEEDEDSYVPTLPPHLIKKKSVKSRTKDDNIEKEKQNLGIKRPAKTSDSEEEDEDSYVPTLPPHLIKKSGENRDGKSKAKSNDKSNSDIKAGDSNSEEEEDMYGPALPPHLLQKKSGVTKSNISEKNEGRELGRGGKQEKKRKIVGPSLPPGFVPPKEDFKTVDSEEEEEDEEDGGLMIGPAPPSKKITAEEYRIQELELRARRMKEKLEGRDAGSSKAIVRESWMLELPEDKPNFCGLGARQFLRKTPREKGDRSIWTDTPADKARKAELQAQEDETPAAVASNKRDDELTVAVDEFNKNKRAKPLIDLHQKKLKKKELESGPKERKPFSREEDLNVNKFDDAQKSNILKKARQLNDRFSAGNRKFL